MKPGALSLLALLLLAAGCRGPDVWIEGPGEIPAPRDLGESGIEARGVREVSIGSAYLPAAETLFGSDLGLGEAFLRDLGPLLPKRGAGPAKSFRLEIDRIAVEEGVPGGTGAGDVRPGSRHEDPDRLSARHSGSGHGALEQASFERARISYREFQPWEPPFPAEVPYACTVVVTFRIVDATGKVALAGVIREGSSADPLRRVEEARLAAALARAREALAQVVRGRMTLRRSPDQ